MKDAPDKNGQLAGTQIPLTPKGGGARILLAVFQNAIISRLNALCNLYITQNTTDGKNIVGVQNAKVDITPLKTIITLPDALLSGGNSGGTGGTGGNVWL